MDGNKVFPRLIKIRQKLFAAFRKNGNKAEESFLGALFRMYWLV
jgi:hypothetical protein